MEQKRHVFFKFVELFHDKNFPQDLKAKALQYVIIPMFAASFDKDEGDQVRIENLCNFLGVSSTENMFIPS